MDLPSWILHRRRLWSKHQHQWRSQETLHASIEGCTKVALTMAALHSCILVCKNYLISKSFQVRTLHCMKLKICLKVLTNMCSNIQFDSQTSWTESTIRICMLIWRTPESEDFKHLPNFLCKYTIRVCASINIQCVPLLLIERKGECSPPLNLEYCN